MSYARNVSKIVGEIHRIWWNMSPIKKLSKRDDQLSSYGISTSWTTSHCHWLENVFYRNIRQRASSGHQVTVEANRHRLPNILSNCGHSVKKWHIWRDWLTMTIRLLHLLSLWHWHWQTGSPLAEAEPEVEEETDLFLKTVAKTLWDLLCVLDNVVI